MHYYEVAPNRIIRSNDDYFTYHSDTELKPGHIVEISLGSGTSIGVVLRAVKKPKYPTKPVASLAEERPLPNEIVQLSLWLSQYYSTPLATVLQTVLPRGLTKKRRQRQSLPQLNSRPRTNIVLNNDQLAAIEKIQNPATKSVILHGITGSGKTAVYIEAIKQTLAKNKSALLLVPEISLTSQLLQELSHHFEDILLTHSKQTEAERHLIWKEALDSKTPRVAIGPRSALFLPLQDIGMIAIDEAHEPSFNQEQSPRYSALRAASILAGFHDAKVVFGSATPSVAEYYLAKSTNKPIIKLSKPARSDTVKPDISLVDMTKKTNFKKHRFLSDKLLSQIEESLDQSEQVLIFHNRRGSAGFTLCENCAWVAGCPRCFIPLTLHADKHELRCHICSYKSRIPTSCPECNEADILHKGIGTKMIESELQKLFPKAEIARFDGDNKSNEGVDKRYDDIYSGKLQIIIGTQVVAKGLDLPKLRTVGVIQADAGLSLPDYTSSERTFQLLAQVIGRVGRSSHPTKVIVQSYQPTHPSIVTGVGQNYDDFYKFAIAERRRANFPPFSFLLKLTCVYKTEVAAIKNSKSLASSLQQKFGNQIEILGPTPAFYERQGDTYRWQLVIKSPKRSKLLEVLEHVPPSRWQYELDPISLL